MKIGIFGGTFDPVHYGHVRLARTAVRECGLDSIYLVPVRNSPFKARRTLSAGSRRLAMCRMAARSIKNAHVSAFELNGPNISYTVRTVEKFRSDHPQSPLFLILGSDSLRGFRQWKNWRKILDECTLAVGGRPGKPVPQNSLLARKTVRLKSRMTEISSTQVRKLARHRRPLYRHCPKEVCRYIERCGLYREP